MTYFPTLPWRRMVYVAGTFALAFASGHVVQSQILDSPDKPKMAKAAPVFAETSAEPQIAEPLALTCTRTSDVTPGIAGMVRIVLSDTCNAGAIVSVSQGQLAADWLLDDSGLRNVSFTPVDDTTPLVVTWDDGTRQEHTVPDDDTAETFRFALAWSGAQYLSLDAQEFGAKLGSDGHITALHAADESRAARGAGGYLTVLGDGIGRTAEVYTFPADIETQGVVRLSVSAPVTLRTCGQRAKATALQSDPFGGLLTSQVDIALPDCDAIGQTLVLRNLFRDLRLAAH